MTKQEGQQQIARLIEKYEKLTSTQRKGYNESMTCKDFILPLFQALGWDVYNRFTDYEVASEAQVSGKRVDYSFHLNNITKFFLEAKKIDVDLREERWAEQAVMYAWHKSVPWAILTDFESLKVFNAEWDEPDIERSIIFEIPYKDYLIDERLWLLSKQSMENGELDKFAEENFKKPKREPVDKQLSADLVRWREILFYNLKAWNSDKLLTDKQLAEGVQRILDRLIFIRTTEDKGIENKYLQELERNYRENKKGFSLTEELKKLFKNYDDWYNSKLFQNHICDILEYEDSFLADIIKELYKNKKGTRYDFASINADVLGSIYEQYLGQIQQEDAKAKKSSKRKSQGIFYTPRYIVDYIVQNTLGEILKGKPAHEASKIKVLDPACGSGSFFIKAFEVMDEHIKREKNQKGTDPLTNYARKFSILTSNIYGVDLDTEAVEIAQLNLLLKTLEKRERLPNLTHNIECGNSLISGTEAELKKYFGENWKNKKPFNWEEKFEDVFKQGGFDVVIGNPPWGADITADYQYLLGYYPNSTKEKKDTYKTFIDKSIQLLKPNGFLGFIIPNSFLYQPSYEDIKKIIQQYSYKVINLGEKIFSGVELPCCILILEKKLNNKEIIIDLTQEKREIIPEIINKVDFNKYQKIEKFKSKIIKKTSLTFDDVFNLKDAGIQYHRSGIGLSNKGGNDLYERIFCSRSENKFKNKKETWYGKLVNRYYITDETDEFFNLDYKSVLNKNESVSFTKEAFEEKEKILWRQTASSLLAVIDNKKRWFRNTIQCGYLKDDYKNTVDLLYALAIFNSKYIDYVYRKMVLETGRVFPQVKIKYLKQLPFILPQKDLQQYLSTVTNKIIDFNKNLQNLDSILDEKEYKELKIEIDKTDKEIDKMVYQLYGLTEEEIKIVEK